MKNKNLWLLLLSLGISSGTILVDRFIMDIPDQFSIMINTVAIIALVAFISQNRHTTKKS